VRSRAPRLNRAALANGVDRQSVHSSGVVPRAPANFRPARGGLPQILGQVPHR
jgi:hypothetical protein